MPCAEAACVYIYKPPQRSAGSDTHHLRPARYTQQAEMQPVAAKLAFIHRTPFSVEDILDPRKFTRKVICAEDATAAGKKPVGLLIKYSNQMQM